MRYEDHLLTFIRRSDADDVQQNSPGHTINPARKFHQLLSALCVLRVLRVFVGSSSFLESNPKFPRHGTASSNYALLYELMYSHKRDRQVKNLVIGDGILRYEDVLRPQDFVLASDVTIKGTDMY